MVWEYARYYREADGNLIEGNPTDTTWTSPERPEPPMLEDLPTRRESSEVRPPLGDEPGPFDDMPALRDSSSSDGAQRNERQDSSSSGETQRTGRRNYTFDPPRGRHCPTCRIYFPEGEIPQRRYAHICMCGRTLQAGLLPEVPETPTQELVAQLIAPIDVIIRSDQTLEWAREYLTSHNGDAAETVAIDIARGTYVPDAVRIQRGQDPTRREYLIRRRSRANPGPAPTIPGYTSDSSAEDIDGHRRNVQTLNDATLELALRNVDRSPEDERILRWIRGNEWLSRPSSDQESMPRTREDNEAQRRCMIQNAGQNAYRGANRCVDECRNDVGVWDASVMEEDSEPDQSPDRALEASVEDKNYDTPDPWPRRSDSPRPSKRSATHAVNKARTRPQVMSRNTHPEGEMDVSESSKETYAAAVTRKLCKLADETIRAYKTDNEDDKVTSWREILKFSTPDIVAKVCKQSGIYAEVLEANESNGGISDGSVKEEVCQCPAPASLYELYSHNSHEGKTSAEVWRYLHTHLQGVQLLTPPHVRPSCQEFLGAWMEVTMDTYGNSPPEDCGVNEAILVTTDRPDLQAKYRSPERFPQLEKVIVKAAPPAAYTAKAKSRVAQVVRGWNDLRAEVSELRSQVQVMAAQDRDMPRPPLEALERHSAPRAKAVPKGAVMTPPQTKAPPRLRTSTQLDSHGMRHPTTEVPRAWNLRITNIQVAAPATTLNKSNAQHQEEVRQMKKPVERRNTNPADAIKDDVNPPFPILREILRANGHTAFSRLTSTPTDAVEVQLHATPEAFFRETFRTTPPHERRDGEEVVSAGIWFHRTCLYTKYERLKGMCLEVMIMVYNMIYDCAHHMLYHPGEPIPRYELRTMQGFEKTRQMVGGRWTSKEDILNNRDGYYFKIVSKYTSSDLNGAEITLGREWPGTETDRRNRYEVYLMFPKEHGRPDNYCMVLKSSSIGVSRMTRKPTTRNVNLFLSKMSTIVPDEELLLKLVELLPRYLPAVYKWFPYIERVKYLRSIIPELAAWIVSKRRASLQEKQEWGSLSTKEQARRLFGTESEDDPMLEPEKDETRSSGTIGSWKPPPRSAQGEYEGTLARQQLMELDLLTIQPLQKGPAIIYPARYPGIGIPTAPAERRNTNAGTAEVGSNTSSGSAFDRTGPDDLTFGDITNVTNDELRRIPDIAVPPDMPPRIGLTPLGIPQSQGRHYQDTLHRMDTAIPMLYNHIPPYIASVNARHEATPVDQRETNRAINQAVYTREQIPGFLDRGRPLADQQTNAPANNAESYDGEEDVFEEDAEEPPYRVFRQAGYDHYTRAELPPHGIMRDRFWIGDVASDRAYLEARRASEHTSPRSSDTSDEEEGTVPYEEFTGIVRIANPREEPQAADPDRQMPRGVAISTTDAEVESMLARDVRETELRDAEAVVANRTTQGVEVEVHAIYMLHTDEEYDGATAKSQARPPRARLQLGTSSQATAQDVAMEPASEQEWRVHTPRQHRQAPNRCEACHVHRRAGHPSHSRDPNNCWYPLEVTSFPRCPACNDAQIQNYYTSSTDQGHTKRQGECRFGERSANSDWTGWIEWRSWEADRWSEQPPSNDRWQTHIPPWREPKAPEESNDRQPRQESSPVPETPPAATLFRKRKAAKQVTRKVERAYEASHKSTRTCTCVAWKDHEYDCRFKEDVKKPVIDAAFMESLDKHKQLNDAMKAKQLENEELKQRLRTTPTSSAASSSSAAAGSSVERRDTTPKDPEKRTKPPSIRDTPSGDMHLDTTTLAYELFIGDTQEQKKMALKRYIEMSKQYSPKDLKVPTKASESAAALMPWAMRGSLQQACQKNEWVSHVPEVLAIAKRLHAVGGKEGLYRTSGQLGGMVANHIWAEIKCRAYLMKYAPKIKGWLTCNDQTYFKLLGSDWISQPTRDAILHWITVDLGLSRMTEIAEKVRHFFELTEMYFIAQSRDDLLRQLVVRSWDQADEQVSHKDAWLRKAIQWESYDGAEVQEDPFARPQESADAGDLLDATSEAMPKTPPSPPRPTCEELAENRRRRALQERQFKKWQAEREDQRTTAWVLQENDGTNCDDSDYTFDSPSESDGEMSVRSYLKKNPNFAAAHAKLTEELQAFRRSLRRRRQAECDRNVWMGRTVAAKPTGEAAMKPHGRSKFNYNPEAKTFKIYMLHTDAEYLAGNLTPPGDLDEDLAQDICCVCQRTCDASVEYTACSACDEIVCKACCYPIRSEECHKCQMEQFQAMREAIHVQDAMRQANRPPLVERRNTNPEVMPGLSGVDVANNMEVVMGSSRPLPEGRNPQQVRIEQMRAHNAQRPPRIIPGSQAAWTPPYAYHPPPSERYNAVPAIALSTPYTQEHPPTATVRFDHPIVPEYHAQVTGVPMQIPSQQDNRYVREATDMVHAVGSFRREPWQEEIVPIYSPFATAESPPTGAVVTGNFQSQHFLGDLGDIHRLMQSIQMNKGKGKGAKGKGKGKGKSEPEATVIPAPAPAPSVAVTQYHGTDTQCSICLQDFQREEYVYRLHCNHLFHNDCWNNFMMNTVAEEGCPNCRGPAAAKSRFKYMGHASDNQTRQAMANARQGRNPLTRQESRSSDSSYESTASVLPTQAMPTQAIGYHQRNYMIDSMDSGDFADCVEDTPAPPGSTSSDEDLSEIWARVAKAMNKKGKGKSKSKDLPLDRLTGRGRMTAMIDPGAKISVIGRDNLEVQSSRAYDHGHRTLKRGHKPITIGGVGTGVNEVHEEVRLPTALSAVDEDSPTTFRWFAAHIVEGQQSQMPAIMGLDILRAEDAVLVLHKGQEMIAFPGPGGYDIDWSEGTKCHPLVITPSGHLALEIDHFDTLSPGARDDSGERRNTTPEANSEFPERTENRRSPPPPPGPPGLVSTSFSSSSSSTQGVAATTPPYPSASLPEKLMRISRDMKEIADEVKRQEIRQRLDLERTAVHERDSKMPTVPETEIMSATEDHDGAPDRSEAEKFPHLRMCAADLKKQGYAQINFATAAALVGELVERETEQLSEGQTPEALTRAEEKKRRRQLKERLFEKKTVGTTNSRSSTSNPQSNATVEERGQSPK